MTGAAAARCAVCGRPAEARWRPFCSRRCADVDLGRWLAGAHVLPGQDGEAFEAGPLRDPDAGTGDGAAAGLRSGDGGPRRRAAPDPQD